MARYARPETATFMPNFADGIDPIHEETAFRDAWEYLTARVQDSTIYYYSKYERTEYKKLAAKCPAVCTVGEVEALFANPVMIFTSMSSRELLSGHSPANRSKR